MAAPHIAGVCALIQAARPNLTVDQVINELTRGSVAHVSQGRVCSGRSEVDRPNFHVGFGRADAPNSVNPA